MKIIKYILIVYLFITLFSCGGESPELVVDKETIEMKVESTIAITEEAVESQSILYISETSSIMPTEIAKKMGEAYGEIMSLIGIAKLEMASAPLSITKNYSLLGMSCDFDVAIPVVNLSEELILDGRIQKGETYAGKVIKSTHVGSSLKLKETYDGMLAYIEANDFERNGYSWEEYVDDPQDVEEDVRRIFIYFPIK